MKVSREVVLIFFSTVPLMLTVVAASLQLRDAAKAMIVISIVTGAGTAIIFIIKRHNSYYSIVGVLSGVLVVAASLFFIAYGSIGKQPVPNGDLQPGNDLWMEHIDDRAAE
jgi:hypothetical protein